MKGVWPNMSSIVVDAKPRVRITLKKGLYSLGWESGSGKSYMYKILATLQNDSDNSVKFCCIDAWQDSVSTIKEKLVQNYDLILVDRWDVRPSEEVLELLQQKKANSVILVDCKDLRLLLPNVVDVVEIEYAKEEIYVHD